MDARALKREAVRRGYFYDAVTQDWTLYEEGATHAIAVWVSRSCEIGWAVYGPDPRFGFWSQIKTGQAETLERAERCARESMRNIVLAFDTRTSHNR